MKVTELFSLADTASEWFNLIFESGMSGLLEKAYQTKKMYYEIIKKKGLLDKYHKWCLAKNINKWKEAIAHNK